MAEQGQEEVEEGEGEEEEGVVGEEEVAVEEEVEVRFLSVESLLLLLRLSLFTSIDPMSCI